MFLIGMKEPKIRAYLLLSGLWEFFNKPHHRLLLSFIQKQNQSIYYWSNAIMEAMVKGMLLDIIMLHYINYIHVADIYVVK